jgi:hypothetical protein
VNPVTGKGAFAYRGHTGALLEDVYYSADTGAGWSQALVRSGVEGGVSYHLSNHLVNLTHDAAGNPIIASKYAPFGTNSGPGAAGWPGLYAGGLGSQEYVTYAQQYYKQDVTHHAGTTYVLDTYSSGSADLWYKTGAGPWTMDSQIVAQSWRGWDGMGLVDIAVGPTGQIAALIPYQGGSDAAAQLYLAEKAGLGAGAWTLTRISSGSAAFLYYENDADLGFDALGNLYIAYYDPTDDVLHLKTTIPVPEPTAAGLVLLVCAGAAVRRRRTLRV